MKWWLALETPRVDTQIASHGAQQAGADFFLAVF